MLSAVSALLKKLRDDRGLSLRELAQLAGLDHAYIHRLETGAKKAPSDEALNKLIRALKAAKRDGAMLRYVVNHSETDAALVLHVLTDGTVTYEEFAMAASASYRVNAIPEKLITQIRKILWDESRRHQSMDPLCRQNLKPNDV